MAYKPVFGILLEFGFHEIKKYIHSGFAKKLAEYFDIVWLAIDKRNLDFDNYFRSTGFPIVYFNQKEFPQSNYKNEARNHSVRRNWMINRSLGAFHNYNKIENRTFRSIFIGSNLLKNFYEGKTLNFIKDTYTNRVLEETLMDYKIEHLFGTGYTSTFAKTAFVTGNRLSIKTWYLVNSWKDLYIDNFLPFNFLDGIFVWTEQMKTDYLLHMSYIDSDRLYVSGNPTFDILKTSDPGYSRTFYSKKYGIHEQADWILYTMMPPGVVNDEIETIIVTANKLKETFPAEEKIIIVRRNPNHSQEDFIEKELPSNMVLANHYCTFDRKNDMIVQSSEGEKEWIDLLHHCALNMSVPSTVTLECLALNKPVINIGFGPDGMTDHRVRQHFEAGFYRPMFDNELVVKAFHLVDVVDLVKTILSRKYAPASQMRRAELASDRIIGSIRNNSSLQKQ